MFHSRKKKLLTLLRNVDNGANLKTIERTIVHIDFRVVAVKILSCSFIFIIWPGESSYVALLTYVAL